ncbi:hypothetical protein G7Y89_g12586 [Cudoniella acicularis]|uniref:Histone deacetylase complex subunit SAP18 n=1 Tax=Cudoniella acicularis TaxID=354080 RepID=A0A8H4RBJ5_9HELO|nr:hypothetical protein G7Y89_g12586 [Cudoniella acicularis]
MASAPAKIDRQTTTPFHLKLFYRNGGFHRIDEFNPQSELPQHVQIYTWQSCTLRELAHLLTIALPSLLPDPAIGTRLAFRLIFPDTRNPGPGTGPGRYMTKELGSVVIGDGGPGILPDEEGFKSVGLQEEDGMREGILNRKSKTRRDLTLEKRTYDRDLGRSCRAGTEEQDADLGGNCKRSTSQVKSKHLDQQN